MKMMHAAVRDGKEIINISSEYESKKHFREDLNRNGYVVIGRISVDGDKKTERSRMYDIGIKTR